jgi:uncharacterized protein YkuJ
VAAAAGHLLFELPADVALFLETLQRAVQRAARDAAARGLRETVAQGEGVARLARVEEREQDELLEFTDEDWSRHDDVALVDIEVYHEDKFGD